MNNLIIKVEDNEGNFFEYDEYIKDGYFIFQIKKTHYIHFVSSISGVSERRRVCYFSLPLTENSFITTEELKKQRYKEKTGYDNPSQNPDIKKKKEETTLKNYGVSNILKSKEVKENGMIEKFGVANPGSSKELIDRAIATKIEKYGNKNNFEKIKITNQIRYGVDTPIQNKDIREKAKITLLKRYGEKYNKAFVNHNTRTLLDFKNYLKNKGMMLLDDYADNELFTNIIYPISIRCHCGDSFELHSNRHLFLTNGCYKHYISSISKSENEVKEFIQSLGFETQKYVMENKKHIDILVKSKNIGFEYDGLYWHSQQELAERGFGYSYHLDKTNQALKEGIILYHIFEDEWINKQEIVKNRIKSILGIVENKYFARNTIIKEIESKTKNDFLNLYHLQGENTSSINYGCFIDDKLLGVMTFSKPRISGENSEEVWELSRFASNGIVMGVASKFIKRFIKDYNPKSIISFSDKRWSTGNLYKKIGFSFAYSVPPSYWYLCNKPERFHKSNFKKESIKEKFNLYDENKTEYENMLENGWDRIWDCGLDKWIIDVNQKKGTI